MKQGNIVLSSESQHPPSYLCISFILHAHFVNSFSLCASVPTAFKQSLLECVTLPQAMQDACSHFKTEAQ